MKNKTFVTNASNATNAINVNNVPNVTCLIVTNASDDTNCY